MIDPDRSSPPNYEEFEAVSLYCPRCRESLPVQQRLLLVLPDGELYEYCCERCGTVVGKKKNDVPFGFPCGALKNDDEWRR